MGDKLQIGLPMSGCAQAHDLGKVEAECEGHIFSVDLGKMASLLPDVVRASDRDEERERTLKAITTRALPEININSVSPPESSCGTIFGTRGTPVARYRGLDGFSGMVEIFAHGLLRFQSHRQKARETAFCTMTAHQWFAFAIAHEMRHWIQGITYWGRWSWKRKRAISVWECVLKFAPIFVPCVLSLFSTALMYVATWASILHAVPFATLACTLPVFFFNYIAWKKILKVLIAGSNHVRSACEWIDRKYVQFVYRYYPVERDADEFAFIALQDPRWLEVVDIKRAEVVSVSQITA